MKNKIYQFRAVLMVTLSYLLISSSLWAQSPEKMSYQAVIRNSSNALVCSQPIGMKISILQGSASGTAVYTEAQSPSTNANGLVSIEIGIGIPLTGSFSAIDWSAGPYFIKTETDPAGGTNYTITGTSQLLSVPYALYAKKAETVKTITETDPVFEASVASSITAIDTANWNKKLDNYTETDPIYSVSEAANITATDITNLGNLSGTNTGDQDGSETKVTAGTNVTVTGVGTTASPYVVNGAGGSSGSHYLGEEYLGGIIFYLYTDTTGTQKGLIVSKTESTATWSGSTIVGANKTSDGAFNMNLMLTGAGTARTWVETLGAGWYLPSIDELSILWHNRFHVNNSSASGLTLLSTTANYWSSTEYLATNAFDFNFFNGYTGNYGRQLLLVCELFGLFNYLTIV